jgi:hypothetical protein
VHQQAAILMDHFDDRGRRLDDPEPYDEPACRDGGVSPQDVKNGHVELYDYNVDDYRLFPVNPVTGCLCRPEDFEREPAGPGDLGGIPF